MYISAFLTPRKTAIKRLAGFLTYLVENDLPVFYRQCMRNVFYFTKAYSSGHCSGFTPDSLFMTKPDGFTSSPKRGQKYELFYINKNISRLCSLKALTKRSL